MQHVYKTSRRGIASLFFMSLSVTSFTQATESQRQYFSDQATAVVAGATFVREGKGTDVPARVTFDQGHYIPMSRFFAWLSEEYKISPEVQFKHLKTRTDDMGNAHHRYMISYGDAAVDLNWLIVHTKGDLVYSFNGTVDLFEPAQTAPALSEADALRLAMSTVPTETFLWEVPMEEEHLKRRTRNADATYFPKGELVYVKQSDSYVLTWAFDVWAAEVLLSQKVYVHTTTGEVIKTLPLVIQCDVGSVPTTWHGTQSINTTTNGDGNYILLDDCGGPEVHTTDTSGNDFVDDDNNWTGSQKSGPATTHFYGMVTMDYYSTIHTRDSYDDAGGDIEIRHIDAANAFYSGGGLLRAGWNATDANFYNTLDVIAHEFTHGVTDNEANLTYAGESGALNESFSDIFGETCEMWFENLPSESWDWLHREDYFNGNNRSLINPNDKGDPDTYLGTNWASTCGGCADNGGVHTNSGVQNYWFYLLTVGGTGTNDNSDDFEVIGIGLAKARTLSYDNLTDQLGTSSDYSDARDGAIAAAIARYGDCSTELKAVMDAWHAVGVGNPYVDVEVGSSSDISCNGADDGSIDIDVEGTGPFTYEWSDGPTTQDRSSLASGTYTVTDATGCEAVVSETITEPDVLEADISAVSDYNGYNISCAGGNDGFATVSGSGGTPPYSYDWSDGQTTSTAINLEAGFYSVTITDANGCDASTDVTLTEPEPLTIDAGENQTVYYGYPPAECATISWSDAGGGVPPYTIEWSDGGEQEHEVCPGEFTTDYIVTLTDDNGCVAKDTVTICVIDVRCGNNLDKVELCHLKQGDTIGANTLCIGLEAVAAHLAIHGDVLAACGTDHSCPPGAPKMILAAENHGSSLDVYPNPFNRMTTIAFSAEASGQVRLQVFDNIGRLSAVPFDGTVEAGMKYQVSLDGSTLSNGVNLCLMRHSDGTVMMKQVVVQR